MSVIPSAGNGKVTVPSILERKSVVSTGNSSPAKITCLTAYDYPTARLLDEAGVDILLVVDSLGMVVLGYESTLPVTLEEMLHHTRAVRRGTRRALLVADMPYGSYHVEPKEAVRHAIRFVKEAGTEAIKIEGGYASVMPELCILCGHCVEVCPNSAKRVRDDLPQARQLLTLKPRVLVSLAPSFIS